MRYVKNSDQFFESNSQELNLVNLLRSIPSHVWESLANQNFEAIPRSAQYREAAITHQLSLLEAFDDVNQMNSCENLLRRHGYDPVLLTLEGAYFETVESLHALNESLWSSVKDFLMSWTDNGSPLGIFQFILDIVGMVPSEWLFGIPTVANLLNAAISFYNENYISAVINLIMAFDLTGVLAAPFKVAFKALGRAGEAIGKVLFKGEAAVDKVAIDSMIKSGGSNAVALVGKGLKTLGTTIIKAGASLVQGLIRLVQKLFAFVPGSEKAAARAVKSIEEFSTRLGSVSSKATEVGETLIKGAEGKAAPALVGAEKTAAAGATAAKGEAEIGAYMAGKSADEIAKAGEAAFKETEKTLSASGFSDEVINSIKAEAGYSHLVSVGANQKTLNLYARASATRKMVANILNVNSEKSVVKMLENPELIKILEKTGARPAEKAIVDAINAGDSAAISKIFGDIVSNPEAVKFIAKNEPAVAKTLNLFKEAPEMLINGAKNFGEIEKTLAKLGKMPKFEYRMKTGMKLLSRMVGAVSARYFRSNCAVSSPDSPMNFFGGALDSLKPENVIKNAVVNSIGVPTTITTNENFLTGVFEEESAGAEPITQADLDALKASSPEAYSELAAEVNKARAAQAQLVNQTTPEDPCKAVQTASVAAIGSTLTPTDEDSFGNTAWDGKRPGGVRDLTTKDDFDKSGLTTQSKTYLRALGLPDNIDPQHETTKFDPVVKAYFCDTWDFSSNTFKPNTEPESRLDQTVAAMVKDGSVAPDQADDLKAQVQQHWAEGTEPGQVNNIFADVKESVSIFKIKQLITKR